MRRGSHRGRGAWGCKGSWEGLGSGTGLGGHLTSLHRSVLIFKGEEHITAHESMELKTEPILG